MVEIIAEVGSVHDGSFGNALKLIELAKCAGADTVKFQTHIAKNETILDAPMPKYFSGEPRYQYFDRTSFSKEQWTQIYEKCLSEKIGFLSSPFSTEAADFLDEIGIKSFKIPSGEVTNYPMLQTIAQKRKKVYLSSGMSSYRELDGALRILGDKCEVVLMQCSSIYPCPPEQVGLNILSEFKNRYGVSVGYSDHSEGMAACIAAVALGACAIEKHITFSKKMYGSDAALAMEPADFSKLVDEIRFIQTAMSSPVNKENSYNYEEMKLIFEKSIVASMDLEIGAKITNEMLAFKKPGDGISAMEVDNLLGKTLKNKKSTDEKFLWDDFI